jgi:hypothetical protein
MKIIMGALHEDVRTFMVMYGSVLPRMRNVAVKICGVSQNTDFMVKDFFRKVARYVTARQSKMTI